MPCEPFIAYARRDNGRRQVAALKTQIESSFRAFAGRELRVFFDTHEIAGMDEWRQKIQRSLRESQVFLAANWRLNATPHANATPRIAFLRHLIARLESQPDTSFLGQLKTLLTGPELPEASDVAVPWDIAYFIEFLKPKLGEHNAEFLIALVAALNGRTKLSALDTFSEWRNHAPVALDAAWPD